MLSLSLLLCKLALTSPENMELLGNFEDGYREILSLGLHSVSSSELEFMYKNAQTNPRAFFELPEKGGVQHGQVAEALHLLGKVILKEKSSPEIQQKLSLVLLNFLGQRKKSSEDLNTSLIKTTSLHPGWKRLSQVKGLVMRQVGSGEILAVKLLDDNVYIWENFSAEPKLFKGYSDPIAVLPKTKKVLFKTHKMEIPGRAFDEFELVDPATLEREHLFYDPGESLESAAVISPDESRIIGIKKHGYLIIWERGKGHRHAKIDDLDQQERTLVYVADLHGTISQDCKAYAFSAGTKHSFQLGTEGGKKIREITASDDFSHSFRALSISPDGSRIATLVSGPARQAYVKIWDVVSAELIKEIEIDESLLSHRITFLDNRRLVLNSDKRIIWILDVETAVNFSF